MSAILGSLLGFTSSLFPAIIDFFKTKEEAKQKLEQDKLDMQKLESLHKQRVEILKLQSEVDLQKSVQALKELNVQADIDQSKAVYQQDIQVQQKNESPFVAALSASVRPVLTYVFFAVFIAVKVLGLYVSYKSGVSLDAMIHDIWDDETNAIFAATMSFWFGQRSIEKFRKK